jgi:hypothetical protein
VAPLTSAARAARNDASRLRSEAVGLRLAVRANVARSHERLERAQAQTERARARRAIPCASPWSGLEWFRDDDHLGRVLVPID